MTSELQIDQQTPPALADRVPESGPPVHRVCLMGASLDIGNRGVAALGASLVKLISEANRGARLTFLVGRRTSGAFTVRLDGKKSEVPVINSRLSPKAPLREQLWWIVVLAAIYKFIPLRLIHRILAKNRWIQAVLQSDWVGDIRGGDSFSDIYGLRRLVVGALPMLAVRWLKRDLILLPQTYGPYKTWLARLIARRIINRASVILSRDRASLDVITSLTGGKRRGRFCPDVAFALDSILPDQLAVEPPLSLQSSETVIGVNVNGLMFNGGYNRANMFGLTLDYQQFLVRLVTSFLGETQNHILLVPHTFAPRGSVESDPEACEKVRSSIPSALKDRVHLVTEQYDQHEIKGVIGLCDFFIGSRMHSCIAALSQNIPTIGVAYSKKFHGVFESIGAGDWIVDGRSVGVDEAINRCLALFRQRESLRGELATRVAAAKERLNETFAALVSTGRLGLSRNTE